MTQFNKDGFIQEHEFLLYRLNRTPTFVARFKYSRGEMGAFRTFLIKNFTVEEYFDALKTESPLKILEAKGYLTPTIRRMLKINGYEISRKGLDAYLEAQVAQAKLRRSTTHA